MVAIRKSSGVRRRIRFAPAARAASSRHGEQSWKVITEGNSGKGGTSKFVPWKTSIRRRRNSNGSPASHQRRVIQLPGGLPARRLGALGPFFHAWSETSQ